MAPAIGRDDIVRVLLAQPSLELDIKYDNKTPGADSERSAVLVVTAALLQARRTAGVGTVNVRERSGKRLALLPSAGAGMGQ